MSNALQAAWSLVLCAAAVLVVGFYLVAMAVLIGLMVIMPFVTVFKVVQWAL